MCAAITHHGIIHHHATLGPYNTAHLITFLDTLHNTLIPPDQVEAKRILVWPLNGGSRFFSLSRPPPFFPPCLLFLSRLISIEETLSARLSKLENYGFDQLVSQRN